MGAPGILKPGSRGRGAPFGCLPPGEQPDELRGEHLAAFRSHGSRPSIDPELMIRMLVIGCSSRTLRQTTRWESLDKLRSKLAMTESGGHRRGPC